RIGAGPGKRRAIDDWTNSPHALVSKHAERAGSVDETHQRATRRVGCVNRKTRLQIVCALTDVVNYCRMVVNCLLDTGAQVPLGRELPLVVDILIGVDYYYDFVTGRMRREATDPLALKTLHGWILGNQSNGNHPVDDAHQEFARMMEKYEDSLSFDGKSRPYAGSGQLSDAWRGVTRTVLITYGWAEPAPKYQPPMRTWYLPHDAVYRGEGEGRKCLVEFDGSARYGGTSLNVLQEAGPTIQTDLLGAVLRTGTMSTVRVHAQRDRASAPRAAGEVLHNIYEADWATSCESLDEARTLTVLL
ncbi:hypothetical protein T07_9703, partial [Trichinella nelsoni]